MRVTSKNIIQLIVNLIFILLCIINNFVKELIQTKITIILIYGICINIVNIMLMKLKIVYYNLFKNSKKYNYYFFKSFGLSEKLFFKEVIDILKDSIKEDDVFVSLKISKKINEVGIIVFLFLIVVSILLSFFNLNSDFFINWLKFLSNFMFINIINSVIFIINAKEFEKKYLSNDDFKRILLQMKIKN